MSRSNNRGKFYTPFKKCLKEESKKLRAKEKEYCDRCIKNEDYFEENDISSIDEVSNPWNWD